MCWPQWKQVLTAAATTRRTSFDDYWHFPMRLLTCRRGAILIVMSAIRQRGVRTSRPLH
jgi:hypothetical protein